MLKSISNQTYTKYSISMSTLISTSVHSLHLNMITYLNTYLNLTYCIKNQNTDISYISVLM